MIHLITYERKDRHNVTAIFGCDEATDVEDLPVTEDLTDFELPGVYATPWSMAIIGEDNTKYYKKPEDGTWAAIGG